jgi:replicative DNA helicase
VVKDDRVQSLTFLLDETEKYVQRAEFKSAIIAGAEAINADSDLTPIYALMGDALKISFDSDVGLNYSDLTRRLTYYKKLIQGISTGVKSLDDILAGGFRNKTLNVVASVSHGGKSLFLAHYAANQTLQGTTGLYYTLEMSEEETCKRIDANIFDIDINLFRSTPNEVFEKKFNSIKDKLGNLIVKEYPAGSLDVLKLEAHMNEIHMKYGTKPAYICIDYLTLMKSTRTTLAKAGGGYAYYKYIAEELHAFAKKYDIPVITAQQINRSGYNNRDAGMENVADSIGIAQTADTFFILNRTKELDAVGQVLFNFVKNRNTGSLGQSLIGVEFNKMRFYDLDNGSINQEQLADSISKLSEAFGFDNDSMFE